jgi:diaminopimelate decarboxylase
LEEVLRLHQSGAIQVKGLHIHTGSDIKNVEAIKKAAKVLLEKAASFSAQLEFLDFGGGFKVAYQESEKDAEIGEIAQWLKQEIDIFDRTHQTKLKMVIEPGKFLVSEAGYFLTEVTQIKNVYGTRFVYLNAGFNHFIRPMYYDAYHHISNLSNPQGPTEKVDVVGFLCENDTFAKDRFIPEVHVGDILCFHNAGAYSYTMSSGYNLRERPAEVLIEGKNVKIIQKRQVFEDLINGQVF